MESVARLEEDCSVAGDKRGGRYGSGELKGRAVGNDSSRGWVQSNARQRFRTLLMAACRARQASAWKQSKDGEKKG